MKIITVPEKAVIKDEKGSPVPDLDIPFKSFLVAHIDNYGDTKTVSQLRQASKLIDAIEKGNGTISLEEEQYKLLKAACEKIVYRPVVSRQLMEYYDAVEKAADQ